MAKQFVEFYFPGVSLKGQNEREVSSRNTEEVLPIAPVHAISYRFFDKDADGNHVNYSAYYWLGKEFSGEDFKIKYPQLASDDLFKSARRIIHAVTGGFYPLSETDIVVPA